jgi:hypothetical protein
VHESFSGVVLLLAGIHNLDYDRISGGYKSQNSTLEATRDLVEGAILGEAEGAALGGAEGGIHSDHWRDTWKDQRWG